LGFCIPVDALKHQLQISSSQQFATQMYKKIMEAVYLPVVDIFALQTISFSKELSKKECRIYFEACIKILLKIDKWWRHGFICNIINVENGIFLVKQLFRH
jgi:hypothetical protein